MVSGASRAQGHGALYALLAIALAVTSGFPVAAQDASGPGALDVRVEGGAVTVRAESVPLREVLTRLADVGQFEVRMSERLPARDVSVVLESVTMRQALQRLLVGVGHAVVGMPGGTAGSVSAVFVLAGGDPSASTVVRRASPDVKTPPAERIQELIDTLDTGGLPESVRAAIEAQLGTPDPALAEDVRQRRAEMMEQVMEQIRDAPGVDPAAVEQIREQLRRAGVQ
jgi:hypothetical protein